MSTKPTVLPRWADVSGDIVEPTSGKKDVGWVPDEEPPAQYMNWLQYYTYLWTEYLSDGVFGGNSTFLNNLDVNGDLTVIGTFSAAEITGTTFVATNEGDIRHAAVEHILPIHFFYNASVGGLAYNVNTTGDAYIQSDIGTATTLFHLPLKAGDTLTRVTAHVYDNAGGSSISLKVWKISRSTAAVPQTVGTQLGSTSTSGDSANMQLLDSGALSEIVTNPQSYVAEITLDSHASVRLYNILYTVSRS